MCTARFIIAIKKKKHEKQSIVVDTPCLICTGLENYSILSYSQLNSGGITGDVFFFERYIRADFRI